MTADPRTPPQRKADVLATLAAPVADVWVATAAADEPYLVPLTAAWHGERIVLATSRTTPTARNLAAHGKARLAFGHTRDVVLIDAVLENTIPVAHANGSPDAGSADAGSIAGSADIGSVAGSADVGVGSADVGGIAGSADVGVGVGVAYAAQNDWDPRNAGDTYVFLMLRPWRIQAWRSEEEIPGRTLMRDGTWLV